MPTAYRTTSLGACASCGAYGGSQQRPTCGPREGERIRLQPSRQAAVDRWLSAIVRNHIALQNNLVSGL